MNRIIKVQVLLSTCLFLYWPNNAGALTQERWVAINQRMSQLKEQERYRPKTGEICFETEDAVAWFTLAGRNAWHEKRNAEYIRLGAGTTFPDKAFGTATVAASNGTLINLDKGTKVKVLDGQPDCEGYGFKGNNGKILILTGRSEGVTCFCDGNDLKPSLVESNDDFFKTDEERKAHQALFIAENSKMSIADALAMSGVKIESATASASANSTAPSGTMAANWQPKLRCALGDVAVPFGKKLTEFPAYLTNLRISVEELSQDSAVRSWYAPDSLMVLPGWGVARGVGLFFTQESGEWALKQVRTVRCFTMSKSFIPVKFKQSVSTLSNCFGKADVTDGNARWDRGNYYINLEAAEDTTSMGVQSQFNLVLSFTQK